MSDSTILKVGDTVVWRGCWGSAPAKLARVQRMELCEGPRQKYGIQVQASFWADKDRLCVDLDNGSWAYGFQLEPVLEAAHAG